jgi:hypothetical protein
MKGANMNKSIGLFILLSGLWVGAINVGLAAADVDCTKDKQDAKCQRPVHPVCFNVFCTYERDHKRCQSASKFTHFVTDDGQEVWNNSSPPFNPSFEVECDGRQLYSGSAHRYTDYLGSRIQAIPGPYPAIVLPRDSLRDVRHYVESSLEFTNERLAGSCYIYTGPQ